MNIIIVIIKFLTMDKVVKPSDSECYMPSPKSCIFYLTFSDRSTRICALKATVEVTKVHIFVRSGI
jgi:hypothetical protein